MNTDNKYIKEAEDFEHIKSEFLTLYDEQMLMMEEEYNKCNEHEIKVQEFREKAIRIESRLRRMGGKLNPFFFDERRSYLLRKQKARLR